MFRSDFINQHRLVDGIPLRHIEAVGVIVHPLLLQMSQDGSHGQETEPEGDLRVAHVVRHEFDVRPIVVRQGVTEAPCQRVKRDPDPRQQRELGLRKCLVVSKVMRQASAADDRDVPAGDVASHRCQPVVADGTEERVHQLALVDSECLQGSVHGAAPETWNNASTCCTYNDDTDELQGRGRSFL